MVLGAPSLDEPLHGAKLWTAGLVLACANFLVVLDTTIANVSITSIAGGLSVSPVEGTWVVTSYAVAEAITLPLTGWLATRYGPVRVFSVAMMMFAFWSGVCGLSHSLGMLVAARVMQGLSGGPMIPLSQSLLLRIFGRGRAGAASGIWAVTTLVAPVLGPIIGGEICDRLSWPWIFYVNLPLAFVCAVAAWRILGKSDDRPENVPVDFVGLGLLVLWVAALQIMLDKGRELDWFGSPIIIALAVFAALNFVAFVLWELTAENPVVDLGVFKSRSFVMSALVALLGYAAFFSGWLLVPLWLQVNMGYTATVAGRISGLNGMLAVFVGPLVAKMLGKVDARGMISVGLLLAAATMIWRTGFTTTIGFWGVGIPNLVQGIAVPFFFIPLIGLSLTDFSGKQVAAAAGVFSFIRTTGGAFGASLVLTEWDTATGVSRADLAASMRNIDDTIHGLMARGSSVEQARAQIDSLVNSQSVMLATNHIFLILATAFIVSACVIWMVPRPRMPLKQVAGH